MGVTPHGRRPTSDRGERDAVAQGGRAPVSKIEWLPTPFSVRGDFHEIAVALNYQIANGQG